MSNILNTIYGFAEASWKAGTMSEKKFREFEKICKPRRKRKAKKSDRK